MKPNVGITGKKLKSPAAVFITINEKWGKYSTSKDMTYELLADHETIIVPLPTNISECAEKQKDAGTADFLTGLIEQHETTAWILTRYQA